MRLGSHNRVLVVTQPTAGGFSSRNQKCGGEGRSLSDPPPFASSCWQCCARVFNCSSAMRLGSHNLVLVVTQPPAGGFSSSDPKSGGVGWVGEHPHPQPLLAAGHGVSFGFSICSSAMRLGSHNHVLVVTQPTADGLRSRTQKRGWWWGAESSPPCCLLLGICFELQLGHEIRVTQSCAGCHTTHC
jgi:hypothetical protein